MYFISISSKFQPYPRYKFASTLDLVQDGIEFPYVSLGRYSECSLPWQLSSIRTASGIFPSQSPTEVLILDYVV